MMTNANQSHTSMFITKFYQVSYQVPPPLRRADFNQACSPAARLTSPGCPKLASSCNG